MDQLHISVQIESEIGGIRLGIVLYTSSNKATSRVVFSHPIHYRRITLAFPPSSSINQIRGHIAGPPLPSLLRYMP